MGYPVVLKGVVPGCLHKTDQGLVKLRLATRSEVIAAAGEMERLPERPAAFAVQRQISGLELIVGIGDDHGRRLHLGHGYSAHLLLARPRSTGEVRLASPDTTVAPLIDPRYFSHPYDMETLIKGTQIALDIMNSRPFDPYRGEMLIHYDRNDPRQIERTLRDHADTEYHACGTCKMGSDAMAVVGLDLKVRGLEGLRVRDSSVMPRVPSCNTNAPTMMIARSSAGSRKYGFCFT